MGYKLAGFDHLGGVEIDPKVAEVYKLNHNPKHLYIEDIRQFNKRKDLPDELFDLDLLDGSPPCSSFSMAGNRDKDWGKKKKFREGQEFQRLDDLVFVYIETIKKLRPKVALLENVKGLIQGNAKAYVKKMNEALKMAGYKVQLFLLNAASMGVPQKRERVFFICQREDMGFDKLALKFEERAILFGEVRDVGEHNAPWTNLDRKCWENKIHDDKDYSNVLMRIGEGQKNWNAKFIYDNEVCNTIASASGSRLVSFTEPKRLSNNELKKCGSYPIDYNFGDMDVKYLIGMSVPPVMTAQIAHQIYLQWLSKV